MNCLTGETDDTRLTPEEMRQLISNVSTLRFLLFEDVWKHIRWLKQPVDAAQYTDHTDPNSSSLCMFF